MAVRGGLVFACLLVSACGFLGPTPPPQPPRQTSMGLAISTLELKNGLRVVFVRDERASEVQVTMRYRVGAKDDPPGQEGVAHLVEHLMFQQVLGGQSLYAKLQTFATFMNAFTSSDATTYVERAKAAHLEEMLSVEAVRVGFRCTSLTDATFVRERAVVLNELSMRGAGTALLETIQDGLFQEGHPYRHRVGGSAASVGAITRQQACAFADAHYTPANAVLVVSGNVSPKTLEEALGKFIARVARRDAGGVAPVPASTMLGQAVELKGEVDDELLVVAWPQPADLAERAKVMAIVPLLVNAIDAEIEGTAQYLEVGDRSAPMFGVAISLGDSETIEKATTGVKKALGELPTVFRTLGRAQLGEAAFDRLRQGAIYDAYARLDDSFARDSDLAAYVLAGVDAARAVGLPFTGLRELDRSDAARVAEEVLRFDRAAVVVVKPQTGKKLGREDKIVADVHDIGQHRDPPDPAEAKAPAKGDPPTTMVPGMLTRVLPNGLRVVLLPVTSVPTVDVRLVFGAGTADDVPTKRGVAAVAANALTWDARYFNDYLLFAAAGGSNTVVVDDDTTTFIARGLDMHIDVLLSGLRRWVRDGRYPGGEGTIPAALRDLPREDAEHAAIGDAWRAALYGADHPYTFGGIARHASPGLTLDDVKEFRRGHFTPDNATLVISGRFDGPLADRWVDFLFADWKGNAIPRVSQPAVISAASLASDEDTSQVQVAVVIPAATGTRAQKLVAAQMLDEIAEDVRHQLGASYALNAALWEARLSSGYFMTGSVESGRTREALELVRARLERLAKEPETAASAFVAARTRVIAQLSALEGTAGQIASRVVVDAQFSRAPLSDLATAAEVHGLTIADMASTLAEIDLARAAIRLAGPAADVDAAFAALGRTAQHVPHSRKVETAAKEEGKIEYERVSLSDLAAPISGQPPSTRFRLTAVPFAMAAGKVLGHSLSGYNFALAGELRLDQTLSVGIAASIGSLDGTYQDFITEGIPVSLRPLSIGASLGTSAYDRVWGRFVAAFHANRIRNASEPSRWETGAGVGLQGGVDVLKLGRHRVGLVGAFETDLFTSASATVLSLGLTYRY